MASVAFSVLFSAILSMAALPLAGADAPAKRGAGKGAPAGKPGLLDATKAADPVKTWDEKFSGKVKSVNFSCRMDSSCDLVVATTKGLKYVHFGHDTRGEAQAPWGNVQDLWDAGEKVVGKTVQVFAATGDHESYTVRGKEAYYVKLSGKAPPPIRKR